MKAYSNIDEYIEACPEHVRDLLRIMKQAIQAVAPEATEKISYGIPTFYLNGNLVHFGGFKDHIGFFPTASGVEAFKEELGNYAATKGTIRFPIDKPLPLDLVQNIVKFRVRQNQDKKSKK